MFIDNDISEKIFELAGVNIPEEITQADVQKALIEIERKLNFFSATNIMQNQNKFNVLIVDDLELSIFQLTQMLKKMGTAPSVARSKEEAIAELKKQKFDFIVSDLYLPDLEDGFSLISEMMKYKQEKDNNFKVITISSTDDEKIINKIYSMGIDEFIKKSDNWHNEILKYIADNLSLKNPNFSTFICEDDICVYTLKHLKTENHKNDLIQNINSTIYSGKPYIILNLENIKNFDESFTSMFSEIYKNCQDASGELVVLSPSSELQTALKNAFLNGLIKVSYSINEAILMVKNKK